MNRKTLTTLLLFVSAFFAHAAFAAPTEEATTVVSSDNVRLSGRFMVPSIEPKAVVVLLPGSGSVGMDGDVSSPLLGVGYRGAPAKLSDELALALADAGIASLRYAKRGYEDPSQLSKQNHPFLVQDAEAALQLAKARFPQAKAGIVGFSEGALVATHVAARQHVDALFLLGLPSRSIDETFIYQFKIWPLELLKKLDTNSDGVIAGDELAPLKDGLKIPLLGPQFSSCPWQDLDLDHNGSLSIESEVLPAAERAYATALGLAQSPAFADWVAGLRNAQPFAEVAAKISAPVYLYQGLSDAQIYWGWVNYDRGYFAGQTQLRLFGGVGHCFSPMDGAIGEVKTSGPFSPELLNALANDARAAFAR